MIIKLNNFRFFMILLMTSFLIRAGKVSCVIYFFSMHILGFAISTINSYEGYKNETFNSCRR